MKTIKIEIVKEFFKGKFYFRKSEVDYSLLPNKLPTIVMLYLGKEVKEPISANLIDSGNGYLRINKSDLKEWFTNENLEIGDSFNVDIINKTTFRIYK